VNEFHWQPSRVCPIDDIVKHLGSRCLEQDFRLAIFQPLVTHGAAEASQDSRHGGVRDLGGDLSAPHVEVGPDYER
jgi:hypothetical protein